MVKAFRMPRSGYIVEVLKGPSKKWYWRLKFSNGRTLASSEIYYYKSNAENTARNLACAIDGCKYVIKDK